MFRVALARTLMTQEQPRVRGQRSRQSRDGVHIYIFIGAIHIHTH